MPDDPYVYPGTQVLRNRYDLRDPAELARAEAAISYARLAELAENPLPGAYDLAHLQAFHQRIFGDMYDWAGEIRTVTISKGDVFALPQHIEPYLSDVLRQLSAEGHLRGLGREQTVDCLTHYLAEINATHPFREGNGRTQRAFIGQLAAAAGYRLDWQHLDPARNIDASQAAHRGDNRPLRAMLDSLTTSSAPDQRAADALDDAFPQSLPRRRSPRRATENPNTPPARRTHRATPIGPGSRSVSVYS